MAVEHPPYDEFIANGGEPIRPGLYRYRTGPGREDWARVTVKHDPTGRAEFVALHEDGTFCNAEAIWTRCVGNPIEAGSFRPMTPAQPAPKTETKTMQTETLAIDQSETVGALFDALAKAQGEIRNAAKDSTNPHFKSRYADLASVSDACRAALSKHGVGVVQMPTNLGDNAIAITTRIGVKGEDGRGEWLQSTIGAVPKDFTAQSVGSVLTYLRRYSLAAMVGVAPGDDDDGEGGVGRGPQGAPSAVAGPPSARVAAKPAPVKTAAQRIAEFWAGDDFHVQKGRLEWSEWQGKFVGAITSAPDAGRLAQLIEDNGQTLNDLRAYSAAAAKIIDGAIKAQTEKFSTAAAAE